MARIVVSGYMVRHPYAGNMVVFLQYVLGLRRLGHEVLYVEDKGWPYSAYDPLTRSLVDFPTEGLRRSRSLMAEHCPEVPVAYVDAEHGRVDGLTRDDLRDALRTSDLFLDVGGMCWFEDRLLARRRAMVDLDPLFTQVAGFGSRQLHDYHHHFTVGTNIGASDCSVPTSGVEWLPTLPPIVSDLWAAGDPPPGAAATTVANWSAYHGVEVNGIQYGQKDVEFRRLLPVPASSPMRLEVALSGGDDDVREDLRRHGWSLRDGADVTQTLDDYRAYIAGSAAEFSPAKHAYVASRSGWVSDRTGCYLAAGRPAVVQDTGLAPELTAGGGLLTFCDAAGALAALESVAADPAGHARAALELVDREFSHEVVLTRLLDRALDGAAV